MNIEEDSKQQREKFLLSLNIFKTILGIMIMGVVLFIFLKQAQIMTDVSAKMNEAMESMNESMEEAQHQQDYSNDYSSDY